MKKIFVFLLALAMTVSLLAACGPAEKPDTNDPSTSQTPSQDESNTESQKPVNQDAVFYGGWPYSTVPTGHFNMFVSNAITLKYFRELHQLALATYKAADDTYQPLLADSWKISEDNSTFTVTLKDNVI